MEASYEVKRVADLARATRLLEDLTARERMPAGDLAAHRRARLDDLAGHASEHAPFWAERLRGAIGRDGSLDLSAVAPVTKPELMERWDDAVTDRRLRRDDLLEHLDGLDHDALWLGEFRAMTTSGSSGLKGLFVYDRSAWQTVLAQLFRFNVFTGIAEGMLRGETMAAIGGARPTHMTRRLVASLGIGLEGTAALAVTTPVPELVGQLNDLQPSFLSCYPSVAKLLADEQIAGRLRISPRMVSTSSELCTPEMSDRIEQAFGVRPYNLYATTEGIWACECDEHAGMHLFDDMCIVENVDADGRPVPPGERGDRLLVTNLFNRTQPLIRFELTDVVTVAPDPCPCGRTLARIETVAGRTDDVLHLPGPSGQRVPVHPLQFDVVTADRDVREFQVVGSNGHLRLRLVLRDDADPVAAEERVRGRVCDRLSAIGVESPRVECELLDALERSPAGKLPVVVAARR